MDIPIYSRSVEIDFNPFVHQLEALHGWNYRDMAGKYKWIAATRDRLCAEHGIDYNVWGKIPYSEMNDEQKAFHDIYRAEMSKEPPYQDVWHWLIDHAFYEVNNGCSATLSTDIIDDWEDDEDGMPDYVRTFIEAVFAAVPEDHPARDDYGINFYIHW